MMQKITLALGNRSYPIFIGAGILDRALLAPFIKGKDIFIVTNETIAPLYLDKLAQQLTEFHYSSLSIKDGEQYKTLASFNEICSALLEKKCARDTTLIALGGGVIGDITGFVASAYQRGVPFIQIPTTLLAQVDSSVGGKTAINHALGKNMIGAFYQPQAVIIDINYLATLDHRHFVAGLAEVIKYALIADYDFFTWLEAYMPQLLARDTATLIYAIEKSCRLKAEIVAADETEQGKRALLNFGHTLGHALEACEKYTGLLHGEAVAVGMLFAAKFSTNLPESDIRRLETLLIQAQLPTAIPNHLSLQALMDSMQHDKKVLQQQQRWILLDKLGSAKISNTITTDMIRQQLSTAF